MIKDRPISSIFRGFSFRNITAKTIIIPGYAAVSGEAIDAKVFSNANQRPTNPSTLKRDPSTEYLYFVISLTNLKMCDGLSFSSFK